jgi:hypothetical protein
MPLSRRPWGRGRSRRAKIPFAGTGRSIPVKLSGAMPRERALLLLLLYVITPRMSSAQTRPLVTEEASTAPAHTLVLETGLDFIAGEPNFATGQPRDRLNGPLVRFVYSPASSVELDHEWVALVTALGDDRFGTVADFGDVSLRAKLTLLRRGSSAFAARFGVMLPQTSAERALGPNTLRATTDLLFSRESALWVFHANAGLALQDQLGGSPAQSDFLAYGLAIERSVIPSLALVMELAGWLGHGAPGADQRSEARLGLRFGRGSLRWDAAVRRGLAAPDGRFGATAGLTYTSSTRAGSDADPQ